MGLLADWQQQQMLLLLWPYRDDVWRLQGRPAQQQLRQLVQLAAPYCNIFVGCHPTQLEYARTQLPATVELLALNYDDAWARDITPLYTAPQWGGSEQLFAHGFQFTAWHGLYPDFQQDQAFAKQLARRLCQRFIAHDLVLEGGAITTDGAGTAIVHQASVQRNNPQWTLVAIEAYLKQQLQLQQIVWLRWANPLDETGGHVDNHAQFIAPDTLVTSLPQPSSPWYQHYAAQLEQLRQLTNVCGKPYHILVLPQPAAIVPEPDEFASIRRQPGVKVRGTTPLLASYVNLVNLAQCMLVPQFGLPSDAEALQIMQQWAGKRPVLAAAADEFIKAGGGLHCMTATIPT
ncbi:agmatine deiminase family protein [Pseudidiomarina sp. PP-1MA]|uniref:Agmatine deiminase family protein n=1 Tax=Pseudidiomarina sp. PP-1MA TaxID=3237706 RepID=A0AB39X7R8_9GAMM